MTYVIGLVALLVALAGIIAYAGDRLGTWVGRRRLTVFGARPRATGQIVGVVVGILIMLTTLGVLALAFQNATQTLVNAQRTADELGRLRVQERLLANQLTALGADLEAARGTIASAEADRETAVGERDLAEGQRDEVQAERDALLTEIDATQSLLAERSTDLEAADADLRTVEHELAQAAAERDAARAEADAARAEADTLGEQVEAVAADLDAANVRLLELQIQASEATENVRIAQARLAEAELAVTDAERARDTALADRDAAVTAREAALGAREAALAARDAASRERDAAQAEADELRATTDELRVQLDDLLSDVAALEAAAVRLGAEAELLQIDNEGLQARNDQLVSGNQELLQANVALDELNRSLQTQILDGNRNLRSVEQQVLELTERLEEEARKLSVALQEFDRTASGEMTFERDQVIYSGAIYARDAVSARDELADFVRRASAATASRGAGEVVLTGEQFNSLVEVIIETEGSDLVRLISPRNQFSPTQVEVMVEAIENTRIFERGRLVVSRQIHLGTRELPSTQDEIRTAIAQVKAEAVRVVRRAGLDELQAPFYEGVSDESFTNQLLRMSGPAVIGVMTVAQVDRAGPARVELVIVY